MERDGVKGPIICKSLSHLAGSISRERLKTSIAENRDIYCQDCDGNLKYIFNPTKAQYLLNIMYPESDWIGEYVQGSKNNVIKKLGYKNV